jgi:peptidoglycan/LPS O-acetylase OafA/YrhL
MSGRLAYLPALDGLRAVAVTAVVLYHLDVPWAIGGFLGVDLFFVISGFLITTLLLREHDDEGRIGLRSFWVRRFRRLAPPMVVMTAATILATRLWGLPEQWSSVRTDAVAALAYVANWRFVLAEQSYFDALLGPSPLLHTWSLAVEEQWYLLWPVAMIGLVWLWRRGHRVLPLATITAAAVASAVWMGVLYQPTDPSRVYYGTDTRAQQLLVGAALAWLVHLRPGLGVIGARRATAWAGLGALALFVAIAATVGDEAAWLYHGGFLAVSVLAAGLVLVTSTERVAAPLRWLESRAVRWVGLRSYGIYLWHWPVIVFVGTPMGLDLPRWPLAGLQVVTTLVLAEASHRLVEIPARTSQRPPMLTITAWSASAVAVVVVALGILVSPPGQRISAGDVARPTISVVATTAPTTSPAPRTSSIVPSTPAGARPAETPSPPPPKTAVAPATTVAAEPARLLVLGDSTALVLSDLTESVPTDRWNVQPMARVGCGTVAGVTIDVDADVPTYHGSACDNWRAEWAEAVDVVQPDVAIVMIGPWEVMDHRIDGVDVRYPSPEWTDAVRTGIAEAVGLAGGSNAPVALLTLPCMQPNGDDGTTARSDPARVATFNELLRGVAVERGAAVLELGAVLCPDGEPIESTTGTRVRFDGVHLTPEGADLVWTWLLPRVDQLVPAGR